MSAPYHNSTPLPTPDFSTSSSLPAAKIWGTTPFPLARETFPVGRLGLPGWPKGPKSQAPRKAILPKSFVPIPPQPIAYLPPSIFRRAVPPPPLPVPGAELGQYASTVPLNAPPIGAIRSPGQADFTDVDLREALRPIFKQVIDHSSSVISDAQLEPMLRATIRRALAEYSPGNRPFQTPGGLDRFVWRLQALFTSRTYEDILFEKTHRYQVEEVFLVDAASLALVSYASSNPARHSSARRIESTVRRLASQLRDGEGKIRQSFKLPDARNVVSYEGKFITLLAVVRGNPNEMVLTDLAFSLDRIEDRFCERFQVKDSPLLKLLQPFLEDCLLIQAPASAA